MVEIFWIVAAVLVGTLSSARLARLITADSFPPAVWFRIRWDDVTHDNGWNPLFHCHWCITPWTTLPILLWGWATDTHWSWWIFNLWMASAYVAGMIVERDQVTVPGED
jgi:hypothetical protein